MNADKTLSSLNPDYPYPGGYDDNCYRIRGQVLGIVHSSDHLPEEDKSLAQELFADDFRKFKEKYGIPEWD